MTAITQQCTDCSGTGTIDDDDACGTCNGTGHKPITRNNTKALYIS